jgi:hypothetical protein
LHREDFMVEVLRNIMLIGLQYSWLKEVRGETLSVVV